MGFAPRRRDGAALGPTPSVSQRHRLALGRSEQAAGPPEVEHLGPAAEDRRDDLGGARKATDLSRTDRLVPHESGAREPGTGGLQVDGDEHGGGATAVEGHPPGSTASRNAPNAWPMRRWRGTRSPSPRRRWRGEV